jgi:Uma2 family endonuclease
MTLLLMPHRLFTVHDYHSMAKAGILTEDDRVELIDGEIVEMAPIGSRHGRVVDRLTRMFAEVGRAHGFTTRVQGSVRLGERSEPQPDLALLRLETEYDDATHPVPSDVFLLVEVADSSLLTDQRVKVPLYGRHGIPETWIVNLSSGSIEVYRGPSASGYETQHTVHRGDQVSPEAFPILCLSVDDILGRA